MSRENLELATIKGHGLAIGGRFNFHGFASDPFPVPLPTRVELGKVGSKYILTTVMGEIMTWEFGPSAKVWADTTIKHLITTATRTLDNGDTVYSAECEHGWMTGFHLSAEDAYAVAEGHGEVSRPLYVPPTPVAEITGAEVEAVAYADTITHPDVAPVVEITGNPWGPCGPCDGTSAPMARKAHPCGLASPGIGAIADALVASDRRHAETLAVEVPAVGTRVMLTRTSEVGMVEARYSDGRANVVDAHGVSMGVIDGRDMVKLPTVEIHTGDGTVITEDDVKARVRQAFGPTVAVFTEEATVIVSPGDTVYRDRDGAQGIVRDVLTSGELDIAFPGGAGMVRTVAELMAEGYEVIPASEVTEAEVWAGTSTMIRRPVRTNLNKRKRKASKVNARRVRGGF